MTILELEAAAQELIVESNGRPFWMALRGPMGVGKSTFVRSCMRALGHQDSIPSPTYLLLLEYDTPAGHVVHSDAYRLEPTSPLSWNWGDYKGSYLFLEWPENSNLPADAFDYDVSLSFSEDELQRNLVIRRKET